MATADEIRAGLTRAAKERERADEIRREATDELRRWLKAARDCDELTMREAAELAGLARISAYELIRD